jgi:dephospho-CoA kinase
MAENGRNEPLRVALTGGIATGKSYCLAKFADLGAATIDADVLAHQAVAPGTAGFEQVRSRFGESIVSIDGRLDQKSLARIVFADANARRALEAIVHPPCTGRYGGGSMTSADRKHDESQSLTSLSCSRQGGKAISTKLS